MRRAPVAFPILAACLAFPGLAAAQGESADVLFQEGLKLFDQGRTHEACERFEASYKKDPALGTLQNLATCHEADGRTARAYAEFQDLESRAAKAGLGQKARENLGRTRAAVLSKKLSKIEIHPGPGANVEEIVIDDAPIERSLWQTQINLDPGPHTFVFRAAGKKPVSQTVSISVNPGVATVDLPRLEDIPVDAPPPPTGIPMRTVGIGVGAFGGVSLLLTAVFGGLTFAKKGAAASHCTGMYCDPTGLSLQDTAHAYAAASTATFVIGLAAAGAGAFLFVWGGRTGARIGVGPTFGPSTAGVHATAAW